MFDPLDGHRFANLFRRNHSLAVFGLLLLSAAASTRAAQVDWDGGTASVNTTVGGNASLNANWGPAGGGAGDGEVPGSADDAYLNDVASAAAVTRTVTVDANQTWKSLAIAQTTEPASGTTQNKLAVGEGVTLTLSGNTPLSTSGAATAPAVIDLAAGSSLAFSFNGTSTATLSQNTLLSGAGTVLGNSTNTMTLTLNGTLSGPSITLNSDNRNNRLILGPNAVVSGAQSWRTDNNQWNTMVLDIQITSPSQWDNDAVTYTGESGPCANMEAATGTATPSAASNYRFVQINLASGNSGQAHTIARFRNTVANDGSAAGVKEAVYASTWDAYSASDSSGGHYLIDLNGQDLYMDRFSQALRFYNKSIQFVNTALDSTSTVRAIDTVGDTFHGASFAVMNGATLEMVGGSWFDCTYNRSVGSFPADSSAVPNSATGAINVDATRRWDGAAANDHAAFNHYLGSGSDKGGNTRTLYEGTDGTLRIVGGDYATSGLILNPLGVNGAIDTTSTNPSYADDTLNVVAIRATAWQSVTNINTTTGEFMVPGHRYLAGTPLQLKASTQPVGTANNVFYYVANPGTDTLYLSATVGGEPLIPTSGGASVYLAELHGQGNLTALPGFVVAGSTTIKGHLSMPVIGGAIAVGRGAAVCAPVFQPTLRVGGVLPVRTTVTVNDVTDTLTLASGSVADGRTVWVSAATVPGGLAMGQAYYVRDASGGSFKVCAWPGEPAIDITSAGASVLAITPEASGTASLTVEGDLRVEGRTIEGYLRNGANISIASINGDGSTVTVTCGMNHGLLPGDTIIVTGGNVPFRGTFLVKNVRSPLAFTYEAAASGAGGTTIVITYSKPVSVNVAIQANASVTVAGNVEIGGVGVPQNCLSTGMGVGIDPQSRLTVNGGLDAVRTVAIVPPVGVFCVGEGFGGVLTGTASHARLTTTLTVAGGLHLNGASILDSLDAGAGIVLTGGADATLGADAVVDIAGTLEVGSGSVVDLAVGTLSAGGIDLSGGGVIDFGARDEVEGALRIDGNVSEMLRAAIAANQVVSSRGTVYPIYSADLGYTTVKRNNGSLILLR